jgi:SAM-dependent methyltransferase
MGQVMNKDNWESFVSAARIRWICSKVESSVVIDIGCSTGVVSILLAREGFEVVGVDFDNDRIEYANTDSEGESLDVRERLRFICGDIYNVDLPKCAFHTAIMGQFLHHQVSPDRVIVRAYELLVDGGKLIITVPFGLHIHPDHKQHFYIASLCKLIYPCFVLGEVEIVGGYLCIVCMRRETILKVQMNSIELALVEREEQAFLCREVALTRGRDARKREAESFKARLGREKEIVWVVKNSFSYRLGTMLVQAFRKPGRNTILLLYRVLKLGVGVVRGEFSH